MGEVARTKNYTEKFKFGVRMSNSVSTETQRGTGRERERFHFSQFTEGDVKEVSRELNMIREK